MDFSSLYLFLIAVIFDYSSIIVDADDFQCLTCDNFIDGPGCGEFSRQIPVRTCSTFCYFAVIQNHSSSSVFSSSLLEREFASMTLTRAIRDCSPFYDMSIEGDILLEYKLGSMPSSHVNIVTIKRCNSEQCNNDFYLKSDELLSQGTSFYRFFSFPLCLLLGVIIFFSKSMF